MNFNVTLNTDCILSSLFLLLTWKVELLRVTRMKFKKQKSRLLFIYSIIHSIFIFIGYSQTTSENIEPPIPVYFFVNPEDSIQTSSKEMLNVQNRIDSLELHYTTTSVQSSKHIAWLYTLVALLGIMNILLFFIIIKMRKELAHMKRFEHQQQMITVKPEIESPVLLPDPESIIEEIREPKKKNRRTKIRTNKSK
jgi:hypothetical protein